MIKFRSNLVIKYIFLIIIIITSCKDDNKKPEVKVSKKNHFKSNFVLSINDTNIFYNYNFNVFFGNNVKEFKQKIKEINQSECQPLVDLLYGIIGCKFKFKNGLEIRIFFDYVIDYLYSNHFKRWSKQIGFDKEVISYIEIYNNNRNPERIIPKDPKIYSEYSIIDYFDGSNDYEFKLSRKYLDIIHSVRSNTFKDFIRYLKNKYIISGPLVINDSTINGWTFYLGNEIFIDIYFCNYILINQFKSIKNYNKNKFKNEEIFYFGIKVSEIAIDDKELKLKL